LWERGDDLDLLCARFIELFNGNSRRRPGRGISSSAQILEIGRRTLYRRP